MLLAVVAAACGGEGAATTTTAPTTTTAAEITTTAAAATTTTALAFEYPYDFAVHDAAPVIQPEDWDQSYTAVPWVMPSLHVGVAHCPQPKSSTLSTHTASQSPAQQNGSNAHTQF